MNGTALGPEMPSAASWLADIEDTLRRLVLGDFVAVHFGERFVELPADAVGEGKPGIYLPAILPKRLVLGGMVVPDRNPALSQRVSRFIVVVARRNVRVPPQQQSV